jgi:hypothetical protein
MIQTNSYFDGITAVAEDYFGPAAPRIIARLVTNHLKKEPEAINENDIEALSIWVRMAVSMLTENETVSEEFITRLKQLKSTPDNTVLPQ